MNVDGELTPHTRLFSDHLRSQRSKAPRLDGCRNLVLRQGLAVLWEVQTKVRWETIQFALCLPIADIPQKQGRMRKTFPPHLPRFDVLRAIFQRIKPFSSPAFGNSNAQMIEPFRRPTSPMMRSDSHECSNVVPYESGSPSESCTLC
jgi:hypothetical protein